VSRKKQIGNNAFATRQLLDNVQWRRDCATKVGLGFALPTEEDQPLMDKSGQVLRVEEQEAVAA
jgi:hypothetical protein